MLFAYAKKIVWGFVG